MLFSRYLNLFIIRACQIGEPFFIKLILSKNINYTISIIDFASRTVPKRSDFDSEYEMDISTITKGLYFLKVETIEQTIIKKFIKG